MLYPSEMKSFLVSCYVNHGLGNIHHTTSRLDYKTLAEHYIRDVPDTGKHSVMNISSLDPFKEVRYNQMYKNLQQTSGSTINRVKSLKYAPTKRLDWIVKSMTLLLVKQRLMYNVLQPKPTRQTQVPNLAILDAGVSSATLSTPSL